MRSSAPRLLSSIAAGLALLSALLAPPTASRADESSALQTTRNALEKYQDPVVAVRDGYFSSVSCVEFLTSGTLGGLPYPAGGMGVHFINMHLVGPTVDPLHPQVLIYEPVADKLRLAAAEWFVPLATGVKARPELFGQPFYGPMMGHYPLQAAQMVHYDLHVWLFKTNPAGMFKPTNPDMKCPKTGYSFQLATPEMPADMQQH